MKIEEIQGIFWDFDGVILNSTRVKTDPYLMYQGTSTPRTDESTATIDISNRALGPLSISSQGFSIIRTEPLLTIHRTHHACILQDPFHFGESPR